MSASDVDLLRQWIGRTERQEDVVTADRAAALAATLDRPAAPVLGDSPPALWHWAYFTPKAPLSALGRDGHPRLGDFMPPISLPRRMWVGGRLRFLAPLRVGDHAVRTTEIRDVTAKSGASGALVFVTLRHEIATDAGLAIVEEQDLVYREPATASAPASAPPAPADPAPADWRDPLAPGPVQLFRYSAVTFNAHRIHYDAPYAREAEGYPGLVVQGPLTATLLAEGVARRTATPLADFSFRAVQPLFAYQPMAVCGKVTAAGCYDLWAETPAGRPAMTATATIT
jgi:3-methylfumaryl-CoA hydratase